MQAHESGPLFPGYIFSQGSSYAAVIYSKTKYFNTYAEAESWIKDQKRYRPHSEIDLSEGSRN